MKETGQADGMVKALMDMALFCDRALRAGEDEDQSSLDTDVSSLSCDDAAHTRPCDDDALQCVSL